MKRSAHKKDAPTKGREKLNTLFPHWKLNAKGTELSIRFHTKSFLDGMRRLAQVAVHIEIVETYPAVEISEHEMSITFQSSEPLAFSAPTLTLARKIDSIIYPV